MKKLATRVGAVALVLALTISVLLLLQPSAKFSVAQPDARVWVAHFAPFADDVDDTAVTVRVSGMDLLTDFKYGDTSGTYVSVPAGIGLPVEVVLPNGTVAVSDTFTLTAGVDYTVSAIGDNEDQSLELFPQVDDNSAPPSGQGKVRITHLAPFTDTLVATEVDIRTDAGAEVATNVAYKDSTPYLSLPAGEYDLKITTPGGGADLYDIAPFTLTDGEVKSAFAIGDIDNQPLEVVLLSQVAATTADVWVAHFAPFASDVVSTAVTVRVNGQNALTDFEYGDTSNGYIPLPALPTTVEIVLPGGTVAMSDTFTLTAGVDYTVSAIGDNEDQTLELFPQVDDNSAPPSGEGKVRITHLAPFTDTLAATEVDIRTDAGAEVATNVAYKDSTPYLSLPAGEYDLKITTPGGGADLYDIAPFTLTDGEVKSAFAIGDIDNQPLDVVLLSQVAATTADVWVAHFAPFASDVVSTAVTVRVNGQNALTDFEYGDNSNGYIPLPALPTLVEIVLPGGTVAMSETFTLTAGVDYTVSAIGDNEDQPLELFAQVDDNSAPPSGQGKVRITHLAPFTDTLAATEVDIRTDAGAEVATNVAYKDSTPYLSLPAGLYNLKITTPGGVADLLDLDPFLLPEGQITSFFAVGDIDNQPLAVAQLTSERGAALYLPLIFRNFGP